MSFTSWFYPISLEAGRELVRGLAVGCACYCAFYAACSRYIRARKGRAWIPTCLTATISTAAGAGVAADIVRNYWRPGATIAWDPAIWVTETATTKFIAINFLSFLIADTGLGIFQYAEHFHVLTGWVHHAVYTLFLLTLYLTNFTGIFAVFAVEELPTLVLGLGTIDKRLRTDNGFGLLFFATRICWHFVGCYNACTAPPGHPIGHHAWFGLLSFALHLHWFSQWCAKYLLRRGKGSVGKKDR